MQLVERHVINQLNKYYEEIDRLCFFSKNLYNAANYMIRQEYIKNKNYLNYNTVEKAFKEQVDYKALPAKVSQQVLIGLDKNWKSFFEANKSYKENPSMFLGRPKLPKYKDKVKGRNLLVYTNQAISKKALKKNQLVKPSLTSIAIKTNISYEVIAQVRIVPKLNHYVVEVVYNSPIKDAGLDKLNIAGIDLGVNNLATITSNIKIFVPIVINGRPLKSINQYFNKKKASLQSIVGEKKTSKKIQTLCSKRNFKVDDYLHKASRIIVKNLVENNIGRLVIGSNNNWKQECNIGKQNNQNFMQIPHSRLREMLQYKAELVGIQVVVNEESYTSRASFLDNDTIPTYSKGIKHTFSGKRIQRGMYISKAGRAINADVNASYNILVKAIPNVFTNGIEGVVVHPVRLNLRIS